ncbi:MAG: His-Xaa-Ser repeat protein HxsA3 [Synergistaceae bacterium]|nr:His-Xaa-Ser repeat protein HxsA3 [Synergistaceae bacterium]
MSKKLFSELESVVNHSISDFLLDEEASIPKGQLLAVGSLMVVLACTLCVDDASAWHGSHSNFGHMSHSNYTYPRHSSHSSHASHASHNNNMFKW